MKVDDNTADSEAPPMGQIDDSGAGSSGVVMGADGGPIPVLIAEPAPALQWNEDNVVCLQGPCKYYCKQVTHFEHGNPAGTFAEHEEPRMAHRSCTLQVGVFRGLTADSPVYECNWQYPLSAVAEAERQAAIASYKRRRASQLEKEKGGDDEFDNCTD